MSLTNFPNGITSFGAPVTPLMGFTGNFYWVKPASGNDARDGLSPDNAFRTLSKALDSATANNNDVVFLVAESNTASATTDYQSTVLNWNKDAVHLIGVNATPFVGQRSRISNLSTATAIVDGLFIVSADNCLIANIAIFQGQGSTNPTGASIAMVVSGERNRIVNCQVSGIGHTELDDATSRSLLVSGSENTFENCYIGLDTVIRATATAEVELSTAARTVFKDCMINSYTSLSTFKALVCASTTDRFVLLKNCVLNAVQNITSAVSPTGAIDSGTINGSVLMLGGGVFGYTNVATADDARTLVQAPAGGLVDMGLASAVDIA